MSGDILIVLTSLLFSALFSGVEISFVSSNKLHIAVQKQQGSFTGRLLDKFSNNSSRFITTILVGNTVSLVIYGMAMAELLEGPMEAWLTQQFPDPKIQGSISMVVLLAQTIVSTILVLATAEFLPKSISLANPYGLLTITAIPMNVIYTLMLPITWVVDNLSELLITKGLRMPYQPNQPNLFGLTDLTNYIQDTFTAEHDDDPDVDEAIFSNALDFKTLRVRDCMIPRKEIIAIHIDAPLDELSSVFISSGHTKILVYEGSIDNVVGYCHQMELFKKPESLKAMMSEIIIVPETMLANALMVEFINSHKSVALVVDEFGGTSGMITMEDIVEEIFGEIEDEYDTDRYFFHELPDGSFLLSARHEVDYLNEHYEWHLPDGDYDTLGGYILAINEDIPDVGDVIETDRCVVEIKSLQDARIDKVKITIKELEQDFQLDAT